MDNYLGDLTDILRASGTGAYDSCSTGISSSEAAPLSHDHHYWHFSSDPMMNFSSVSDDHRGNNFGDPFSNMTDPFLHELDMPADSTYFNTASSADIISTGGLVLEEAACFGGALIGNSNTTSVLAQKIFPEDDMRRPYNNILSNMIQISPSPNAKLPVSPCDSPGMVASPRVTKPSAVVSGSMINANTSKDCLVDNTGMQISSPRNPGLKRRKSQAKKSICIPAPAAANSRQSGEVVPSDLWAWRKYGQKPIKGSPYPRGYYRCSSSKGCPARKQVERSRTDPNMLVITYTSEHNHPWPTQRNALAGSTRSQPSKNNAASKNISETTQPQEGTTRTKEEQQEISNSDSNLSPVVAAGNSANSAAVKEEIDDIEKKQLEMEDGEFSDGFTYKSEDFFEELGEIEADSLNLLFTHQGFNAADVVRRESKALDPLHFFDWSGDNSNNNTTSFEEPKRRLL